MYGPYDTPKFWKDYNQLLTNFVRKRVACHDDAKDLLQEIFYKVYTYCQRYEFSCEKAGIQNLRSWIFQIAQNTITDYYRSNRKYIDLETVAVPVNNSDINTYGDMSEYVEPLLSCLPEMYRIPLAMDLEGTPQKEIAVKLGMGLPAIKSRIQRSRVLMKELLHECFYLKIDNLGQIDFFEVKPDCETLQGFLEERKCTTKTCV
ncbi:sigma-70 family RNA polymerase sigma factor [Xanthocytophaga agilis]|uniref:Sigma-70 family RNA polymerase sigma factor n=1 Tax=Xanthocytophaga agilis TaxID=3048010 RepID=A0AAE3RB94_9BACT|nr:sigma-70 family RNA polymerase sigma factor [Xanthocytophaga agilis]MDJ1504232.1 sigma-70 family RNA polymerase sigma factor [Xanthocytophaga agilis]